MTPDQLDALFHFIDARLDERIEQAFGRDSLRESILARAIRTRLIESFGLTEDDYGQPVEREKCPVCKTRALPCNACGEA